MVADTPQPLVRVRKAEVSDAARIAKLGSKVFSATFGHSVTPQQLQDYLRESYSIEAVTKDITDPMKDTIVAVIRGNESERIIVGFTLLTRGSSEPCIAHLKDTVELQRLYVDSDFHGRGVGKVLANALEGTAREQGFRYMWLGVWEENYKAQKVYEKLGYKVVGDHEFVVGGDVQTDYVMLKEL